jgi:hypothetical protein
MRTRLVLLQVCVLEDDAKFGTGMSRADVNSALRGLDARHPRWGILQLGGEKITRWAPKTQHKRSKVKGVRYSEKVFQSHAYIIRPVAARLLVAALEAGFKVDNAICSVVSKNPGIGYFCDPSVLVQGATESDILAPGVARRSWKKALRLKKAPRAKALRGRQLRAGKGRVKKSGLKAVRGVSGELGGKARAGGGSTTERVLAKELAIKSFKKRNKRWPLRSECDASYKVWARVTRAGV